VTNDKLILSFQALVVDLEIHEANKTTFCDIWEHHSRHQFRVTFWSEMNELVGYPNGGEDKVLAIVDGHFVQMIIIPSKEVDRPLYSYRGRVG